MILILLAMVSILLVAGVLLLYVAYPHRGRTVPRIPWLGVALRTAALYGRRRAPRVEAASVALAEHERRDQRPSRPHLILVSVQWITVGNAAWSL